MTHTRCCTGSPTRLTDVVVIGGGAAGAAAAWRLARTGVAVVLLEERSARELRRAARGTAWSAHPSWVPAGRVPLLEKAVRAWREVEHETGASLLTRADAVDHGDPAALAALPGDAERLDPAQARLRCPGVEFAGPVLLRRGAALQVRADHAVAALHAAAVGHGAQVRYRSTVLDVQALDDGGVEVHTAAGRIRARRALTPDAAPAGPRDLEPRGVELHFTARPGVRLGTALVAHHDPDLGLVRAVRCARGHLAVGADTWPAGTVGDLRDHVRTWFPGLDADRPEPVGPSAMSTASGATATALGAITSVLPEPERGSGEPSARSRGRDVS